jgi:hypothetical protein
MPLPPASTLAAPSISGTTTAGQTLAESHGEWTNSPIAYSYQWEICDQSGDNCSVIIGATSQTYVLTAFDVAHTIVVQETASNGAGTSSPASSAATGVVAPASTAVLPSKPSNDAPPVISGMTAVGQTLSTSAGAWSGGTPSNWRYQWSRCSGWCSPISGATATSYTLTTADEGDKIAVLVTAANSGGSATASSTAVGPVVAVAGTPRVRQVSTRGSTAIVSVGCSGPTGSSCSFTLKLSVTETLQSGNVIAVTATASEKTKRRAVLGSAAVTVAAGRTTKVKISLNNAGKQLLAARHKLNVTLAILRGGTTLFHRRTTFKARANQH